jgi:hypothetical protein
MPVRRAVREAADEPWIETAARAGVVARGLVYVVLAYLIARIASGVLGGSSTGNAASAPGIADAVGQQDGGRIVLFVLAAGLLCYALLSLLDAVVRHRSDGSRLKRWGGRAISAWSFALYGTFSGYAFATALSGRTRSGSARTEDARQAHWSARVLRWPAGWLWLGALGAVLLVVAAVLAWQALRGTFRDNLDTRRMSRRTQRIALVVGRIGHLGRASLFGIAGGFIATAAVNDKPSDGQGVDGSVRRLAANPAGATLLYVVAVALLAFGCYLAVEARYRRI